MPKSVVKTAEIQEGTDTMNGISRNAATKRSLGLRIALIVVCAAAALLGTGFGLSFAGLKRTERSLSAAQTDLRDAQAALSGILGELEDTRAALEMEQRRANELGARAGELEARLNEQESRNDELSRDLDEVRAQMELVQRLKSEASGCPDSSDSPTLDTLKVIALTFDDGPGETTVRLLDELKARGMKATFFVVGNRAERSPDILRRMVADGHEVGTHTYSHPNLTKLSAEERADNIQRSIDAITAATGKPVTLLRPPGGSYNDEVKAYCAEKNLRIIYWSVDTRDWESHNKEKILATAFQSGRYGIQDGAIVLMHDIYTDTVDAAVEMMDQLRAEGYLTVTVSELLLLRQGGGVPGEGYVHAPPA